MTTTALSMTIFSAFDCGKPTRYCNCCHVTRLYSEYLFLDRFKSEHNVSAKLFHLQVQQSVAMLELCARSQSTYHCLLNRTLHMTIPVSKQFHTFDTSTASFQTSFQVPSLLHTSFNIFLRIYILSSIFFTIFEKNFCNILMRTFRNVLQ